MLIFGRSFANVRHMDKIVVLWMMLLGIVIFGQTKGVKKSSVVRINSADLVKVNDSLPDLIPHRENGRLGYVNQKGKIIIKPEYQFGTFFWEDCNLLNSPNEKVRKFGQPIYASVTVDGRDFRINKAGTKVYTFKKEDLGNCSQGHSKTLYAPYILQGYYGIVNLETFESPLDYRQFQLYPQYEYLYVMESKDSEKPMVIATKNDRFGIIDIDNNIIIPFEYADIKRNFSWKMARMFEVTKDGKNYFYIDENNKAY